MRHHEMRMGLDDLYRDKKGLQIIYNDLYQWNVKVHQGQVYALDFENLMRGYPVQDIATTLFYVRWHKQGDELTEAYRQGYTQCRGWLEQYVGQIDAFIGGHGIMLINYLLICDTPGDQQLVSDYLARVEEHLRGLLD